MPQSKLLKLILNMLSHYSIIFRASCFLSSAQKMYFYLIPLLKSAPYIGGDGQKENVVDFHTDL